MLALGGYSYGDGNDCIIAAVEQIVAEAVAAEKKQKETKEK